MRVAVAFALSLVLIGGAVLLVQAGREQASAAGTYRIIIPGIASDPFGPLAATPTPTPTPTPGAGTGSPATNLRVSIKLDIDALEDSLVSTGLVGVNIRASGDVPFAAVTGLALSVADHPVDAAGCVWPRTFADPNLYVTVVNANSAGDLLVEFEGATWHYQVQCPDGPTVRFPAFGEIPLVGYFLGYHFATFRRGGVGGFVFNPPAAVDAPPCIKRQGTFQGSDFNGTSTLWITVYDPNFPGGCVVP